MSEDPQPSSEQAKKPPDRPKLNIILENSEEQINTDNYDDIDISKNISTPEEYTMFYHKNSIESPTMDKIKFSSDLLNFSKQKLHEYLNEDLIKAIEASPISKNIIKGNTTTQNDANMDVSKNNQDNAIQAKNSNQSLNIMDDSGKDLFNIQIDIVRNKSIENSPNDKNQVNIIENLIQREKEAKNDQEILNSPSSPEIPEIPLNIFDNKTEQIEIKAKNLNTSEFIHENKQKSSLPHKNINEIPSFIPNKYKNKINQSNKGTTNYNQPLQENQENSQNSEINSGSPAMFNVKNKFDNQKIPTKKKQFEIRKGDWICPKCSNLNFSFRIKCNRCQLSKENALIYRQKSYIMEGGMFFPGNFPLKINPDSIYGANQMKQINKKNVLKNKENNIEDQTDENIKTIKWK